MGKDGKTAYERLKGKKAVSATLEFGEQVLYRVPLKQLANTVPRWLPGTFLGKRWESGGFVMATPTGDVITSRATQRVPLPERWKAEALTAIKGTPWDPNPGGV